MKNRMRSMGFYIELILNVLFFTAITAVVLSAFGKTYEAATETREANAASNICFALLQEAKANCAAEIVVENETVFYNENWEPCLEEDATYTLSIVYVPEKTETGTLWRISATVTQEPELPICDMHATQYVPSKAGGI